MVQISASVSSAQGLPPFLASSPPPERGFSATLSQASGDDRSAVRAPGPVTVRQPVAEPGKILPGNAAAPAPRSAATILLYGAPVSAPILPALPVASPPIALPRAVSPSPAAPAGVGGAAIDLTLPPVDVVALKDLLPPIPLTATDDDGDTPDGAAPLALDNAAAPTLVPGALPPPLPQPLPLSTLLTTAAPATAATAATALAPATPPATTTVAGAPQATSPDPLTTPLASPVTSPFATAATPPPGIVAADGSRIIIETGATAPNTADIARPAGQAIPADGARATSPVAAPAGPAAVPPAALIGIAQPAAIAFAGAIAAADTAVPARRRTDDLHDPAITPGTATVAAGQRAALIAADLSTKPIDLRQQPLAEGLAERIEALRDTADAASSRIRLVPEGLGKIDIALRRDGETLHVHFAADVAATRAALTEAQPKLAEIAAQRGLALGDTSVGDGAGRGAARQASGAPAAPVPVRPTRATATEQLPSAHRIA